MSPFIAELLGTALLVLFGNGVVANVVLARTKGHGAGWLVINFGWGMAVCVAVFCSQEASGAHLNPAVTIALAAAHKFDNFFTGWDKVPVYIAAQMIGAILGACLVYLFYQPYFDATDDRDAKLASFSTAPNIRSFPNAVFCEVIGTCALVLPLMLMAKPSLVLDVSAPSARGNAFGMGFIGALPVGILVFAIGVCLGGTTGYAINPARDLGPRIAHFFLPIRNKRDSDWGYAWVPVVGPILGGLLAVLIARAVGK